MVSVIIPTYGKLALFMDVMRGFNEQSYCDFECIVVDDGNDTPIASLVDESAFRFSIKVIREEHNVGPATGRNIGAREASGDILLFVGSDCYPHQDLIAQHYYSHMNGADIVQGYTPWHPDVVTEFYDFLDDSGLQAAWTNLKDDNKNWLQDISPAFCLTTNYSIKRQLFMNERFDESFRGAAWEDVQLGHRLSTYGHAIKAVLNHAAINYHYHRYDLFSFVERSRMEGYYRLTLCKLHPEMAWRLVNPHQLREARKINLDEMFVWARELDAVDLVREGEQTPQLKEIKYSRYAELCHKASLIGVLDRIKDEHPAMQALEHIHANAQVIQVISGVAALEKGYLGYASHCAQWFVAERDDDWSAYSFLGEVELECGNIEEAIAAFRKSLEINAKEDWPRKRLKELT